MSSKQLQRFLSSPLFSLIVLVLLVSILAGIAYSVTKAYQKEPDFGGMLTLRQADMEIDGVGGVPLRLSRDMILSYVTSPAVLKPVAEKYSWNVSFEQMKSAIDVKERLSSQNSYIVTVNTGNMERSAKITRELVVRFLENYRREWAKQSRSQLDQCSDRITNFQKELGELKSYKGRFQESETLTPLNTDIEMTALNEQLAEAQTQFTSAYAAYISNMESKRAEFQLEYDLARLVYTEDNAQLRKMKMKLDELGRQCDEIRRKMREQKPDLFRMTMDPPKLEGLPSDILYFYDNVQTLQKQKLGLMLDSLIKNKESMLKDEQKKKRTIQHLLDSNSCDVFVREGV